jgi:DNA-binding response OmpR family regulator
MATATTTRKTQRDAATVLIIEDDLDTRDVMGRLLSAAGYSVRLAANGWEGLVALDDPPQLILLDIMLPGMDGYTFLKSLRAQRTYQSIPVIVVTGKDVAEVESRVRPHGVRHVIAKDDAVFPKLKAAIRTVLNRPPPPHARVNLPERGIAFRPYLAVYLKMLAWC